MDFYSFYLGESFEAYRHLGAHPEGEGTVFRTFAPGARAIAVIGDFNDWQETPLHKVYDGNFWEVQISDARPGMRYKYRITGKDGRVLDRCDPYGFFSERRPGNASVIWPLTGYRFGDEGWMRRRSAAYDRPLNIYEVHLGSWRRPSDEPDCWYSYRELAELLPGYLREAGYNYLELLPLTEHPCDASWGYQSTGFFSPTARYGTPDDLRYLIDCCHRQEIGVILDFVPTHFAVDDFALWQYDGTSLYEYPSQDVGYSQWGSCNFMHSRGEVRSFLQSAALYWLREFHFDGLRFDAVSNLIYWQGNPARGENRAAIRFLQTINAGLKAREPQALLIAEDSSQYEGVTRPVAEGGLGFDYKWDLGWMHDTLSLFQMDPAQRPQNYHKLTFSMMYFASERYLLPFSHDEVVHGKATILQKMNGDYDRKFPQARTLYLYMMAHPGKKLNFMGNEIGQLREWDENRQQDWLLRQYPIHDGFYHFICDLNRLYLTHPAFYRADYQRQGFAWLDCHQEARCLYTFERRCREERMVFVFNLSDREQRYELPATEGELLRPVLSTDWQPYGGTHPENRDALVQKNGSFEMTLAPFSGVAFVTGE